MGLANSLELAGANGGTCMKINCRNGDIERKFEWPTPAAEGDTHGFTGMGCTPAVVNGKIYFSAFNGKLYCLDQDTLKPVWITDLRNNDPAHGQPVSNTLVWTAGDPPAAGWSSPLVVNGRVYVGMGEGENPALFGFVFCLDAETGNVIWIYCTCQTFMGVPNRPNVLPPAVLPINPPPKPFTAAQQNPPVRGCSVWSSIAYDPGLKRIYCATGNPSPDSVLPTNGFSNGILSLDALTGAYKGFFQAPPESSYRATDNDVDFGGSPMLFTLNGRTVVCAGCKNGGFFVLDADSLALLIPPRQLLPYYNDGTQIPTVDPHVPPDDGALDPRVPNRESDEVDQENYSGTYSTPAVYPQKQRLFIGVGGNNYHNVAAGIDFTTTPFLRALDWNTLKDAWEMDDSNPRRYIHARPPMYTLPGESGLSSPAVVNDLVFCSTSIVALYALDANTGKMLWQDVLGEQTGGFNGGYGYCLGPAVSSNYVVAGGLVFGRQGGGVLRIYTLP